MRLTHKHFFWFWISVGAIFRVTYSLYTWLVFGLSEAVDQKDYLQYAEQMHIQGIAVMDPSAVRAFSGPGFPIYVYLVQLINLNPIWVVAINIILSIVSLYFFYKIAVQLFNEKVGLITLAIASLYLPFFMFTGFVLKESLLILTITLSIYHLIQKPSLKHLILLAFFFTWTFHIDERYLLYAPIVFLALFFKTKSFKAVFSMSLFILLFSAPWLIRNYAVYDRVVILTERFQSPFDKKVGNQNRLNLRNENFDIRFKEMRDSMQAGHTVKIASSRERSIVKAINGGVIPHDYNLMEKIWYNAKSFWWPIRTKPMFIEKGWKYLEPKPLYMNVIYGLMMFPLMILLVVATYIALKNRNKTILLLVTVLMYHTALHVLLISGIGRYRFPLDMITIFVASWALFMLFEKYYLRQKTT